MSMTEINLKRRKAYATETKNTVSTINKLYKEIIRYLNSK